MLDFALVFQDGRCLRVFCDRSTDEHENYSVFQDDEILNVLSGGTVVGPDAERAEMMDFREASRQDMGAGRTVPAREPIEKLGKKYRLPPDRP